jgi:hypothetical protein
MTFLLVTVVILGLDFHMTNVILIARLSGVSTWDRV